MKNKKLRNPFNISHDEASHFEHPEGESLTVPDMAIPLRTLLDKHTIQGVYQGPQRESAYNDETFVPNPRTMDFTEVMDYIDDLRESNNDLLNKLNSHNHVEETSETDPSTDNNEA